MPNRAVLSALACSRATATASTSASTSRAALVLRRSSSSAAHARRLPLRLRLALPSPSRSLTSRTFSTSSPVRSNPQAPGAILTLTQDKYDELADRDMDVLHDSLESMCEEKGDESWEVEYSSGVLTLSLPPHGTYVINKQPPNQQIWISSPISGPGRFSYSTPSPSAPAPGPTAECWVHHRKGEVTLGGLLDSEIKDLMQRGGLDGAGWSGTGLR